MPGLWRMENTDADRLAWLRLARSRNVGPATFRKLIGRYGGASAALTALPNLTAAAGREFVPCTQDAAEREMEAAMRSGAQLLRLGAPDYPARLGEIPDPPPVLWALGDPALAQEPVVAIVGARNASSAGLAFARSLATDLGAAGRVVASGMARGIDAAAHEASLKTGAIAVLAGGVDQVYPAENAGLYERLAARGLLLSQEPMGLTAQARHFPRRNRIIAGLSLGVALVEAARRSGSLITARYALEQGREVMAAPGGPLDPRAAGCNDLIRDGAALIRSAADVEEALGAPRTLFSPPPAPTPRAPVDGLAARALTLLSGTAVEIDALARDLDVPASAVQEALTELDLDGRIERRPGGLIALASEG